MSLLLLIRCVISLSQALKKKNNTELKKYLVIESDTVA